MKGKIHIKVWEDFREEAVLVLRNESPEGASHMRI